MFSSKFPSPEDLGIAKPIAVLAATYTTRHGAPAAAYDAEPEPDAPKELLPLDKFAQEAHRHEQVAAALAVPNIRCKMPYQHYVPCPGSGPGTPAVSVATAPITAPKIIVVIEPETPATWVKVGHREPAVPSVSAIYGAAPPPLPQGTTQTTDWLALVLGKSASSSARPRDHLQTTSPRQGTPTSTATLDGMTHPPVEEKAPKRNDAGYPDSDDADMEEDYGSAQTLKRLYVPSPTPSMVRGTLTPLTSLDKNRRKDREERVVNNDLVRWCRPIRMRQAPRSSPPPPQKKARTGSSEDY